MRIVDEALGLVADKPRLGVRGYALTDAKAYALLGKTSESVSALRQALIDGWRGDQEAWWMLDRDPCFAVLHDDPRFKAIISEANEKLVEMRQSLERRPGLPENGRTIVTK